MPPLVPMPVARPISVLPASRAAAVLIAVLGMVLLRAADLDNDSLDDAWEAAHGYSTLSRGSMVSLSG